MSLNSIYVEQIVPADHADMNVATILISQNSLLRMGLKHILTDTRFVVSDVVPDDLSRLYGVHDATAVLFIIDENHSSQETLATVKYLKTQCPAARVVVLADHFEPDAVRLASGLGVNGFCVTTFDREVFVRSLELIMLGESVFPSSMVLSLLDSVVQQPAGLSEDVSHRRTMKAPDPKVHKLSAREREILRCLMQGEQNKVIARKLDVAEATVKVHVKAILRKIGAGNRTQAALWATEYLPPGLSDTSAR